MSPILLDILTTIPDPRRAQGRMYGLAPVLMVSVLAVLSGATSYRKVHGFIDTHLSRLNKAFDLGWRKAPAPTSVSAIIKPATTIEMIRKVRRTGPVRLSVSCWSGVSQGRPPPEAAACA